MAQRGALRLDIVMTIGIVSAVTGDGIGYWLGRRYGRRAIERRPMGPHHSGPARPSVRLRGPPRRVGRLLRPLRRRSALPGRAARGRDGLRPLAFAAGNVLDACLFVPIVVGLGYLFGRTFGDDIERLVRRVEHVALGVALVLALVLVIARVVRARRVPA